MSITFFFFFLSTNTPSGESTAAAISPFPLDIDSDFPAVPHGTQKNISLVPAAATLVLQELLTTNLFWCAAEETTLEFGRGKRVRQNGGKGSAKVANAIHEFAFRPGSTQVARNDEPLHLRGKTRRPSGGCAPVLFCSILLHVFTQQHGRKTG